jgi:CheY-like chemotaxis protein
MIIGNVELARQDVGPDHPALVSLEEIGKASRRAKDLVQQILAFSRHQKIERKATALAPVVRESARLLRAGLPAKVSLKVNCESNSPAVLADAMQISQILLNLCGNALHAVQDQERSGAIEIRLQAHAQREARGGLLPGRYACLTVRDNGAGMDAATRARIFEPFFTTKQVGEGTGLGLAVVFSIVQAHEATIEVESTPGQGSAFHIYFPAAETQVAADTAAATPAAPIDGKGKHILYVDDEEGIILLMQRLLERQGYRVSAYTDPREALAAVRADAAQFDLVVTDYNMPHMSGLELAQALREIRADLPVVLTSGYLTEELRAAAPAAGIRELIYKPNSVDELCAAVARCANVQSGNARPS